MIDQIVLDKNRAFTMEPRWLDTDEESIRRCIEHGRQLQRECTEWMEEVMTNALRPETAPEDRSGLPQKP